jgi:flagellar biosynthetic protein FliP
MRALALTVLLSVFLVQVAEAAEPGLTALSVTTAPNGEQTYTLSIQILILMTVLTLLPAALLMMTSFTRIIIVLAILRQALGTAQTPTTQTLIGLALFLTAFIMTPVFSDVYAKAVEPYMNSEISLRDAVVTGSAPLRTFMTAQTRTADINLFYQIAGQDEPEAYDDLPLTFLVPAFVTSELKTAFQIGFLIFIPFLIIDLVVASVLMSMGMMMLSPLIISLPFKIMLFVLVDGWSLIIGTLATSFYV